MESGTLDFDDLMDTGDEYPGFEIAKFTPANDKEENDDSILRTPEHKKEADDFVISESKGDCGNERKEDSTDKESEDKEEAERPDEDPDPVVNGTSWHSEGNRENEEEIQEQVEELEREVTPDEESKEKMEVEIPEVKPEDGDVKVTKPLEDDVAEPPRKKKMYLQPPKPKSKMRLWGGHKAETEHKPTRDADDSSEIKDQEDRKQQNGEDLAEKKEREGKESGEKDSEEKEEEKDDPHQQSFLSFLNLKKGMSKPKEAGEKQHEEEQEKEFYSRKRLRTRKKVSYVYEDDVGTDDEDYQVEDDEELDKDHCIDLASPKRRHSRSNSRGKPNQGVTNYAKALQNLLPGVDLSWMEKQKSPEVQEQVKPMPKMSKQVKNPGIVSGLQAARLMATDKVVAAGAPGTGQFIKGLFECGICGTFFSTASQFILHQEREHVGEKKDGRSAMETFRCEICNFVLTNRFAYLEHKKMKHNKSINFTCNKCKTSFTSVADWQKHQEMCGKPSCSICNLKFKSWVDVGDHKLKVHAGNSTAPTRQWLSCAYKTCQFKCLTQYEMRAHTIKAHKAIESFGCNAPRCSKVFNTREELNEHKKEMHASEFIVQYQCVECKNCFSSKTLLAEHQYLHTMEKLRKCDLCSRSFGTFPELRRHREVHVAKGTLRCLACTRWCVDRSELTNHICSFARKNSVLRIYFCDVCQKDFKTDEKMFAHRKEHKNFYQCATCLEQLCSEAAYIKHQEEHGKYICADCFEEVPSKEVQESHREAHRYYVKLEDMISDGKSERVMFLCPNLVNVVRG